MDFRHRNAENMINNLKEYYNKNETYPQELSEFSLIERLNLYKCFWGLIPYKYSYESTGQSFKLKWKE